MAESQDEKMTLIGEGNSMRSDHDRSLDEIQRHGRRGVVQPGSVKLADVFGTADVEIERFGNGMYIEK